MNDEISYKSAGVDIDNADNTKRGIAEVIDGKPADGTVLNKVGAFASLIDLKLGNYKDPILVMKTEEPGSKQLLALKYDKVESIAHDMINHLTNDVIVMGAKPVAVQDAIICGKLDATIVKRLVKGMADACENQECRLVGGETSEQPGVIGEGTYILTSCMIGVVERDRCVDGSKIKQGDKIIAIPSNGLHTNGYSLVRKLMEKYPELAQTTIDGQSFIDLVLKPHTAYHFVVKALMNADLVNGMAHITGGGVKDNLQRILPENIEATIDLNKIEVLPIFKFIKEKGNIPNDELFRVFNCGVGLTVVVDKNSEKEALEICKKQGFNATTIGEISAGNKQVNLNGTLETDCSCNIEIA
jgi:phosphoribosylformylglycinamidine cyclo-ligase